MNIKILLPYNAKELTTVNVSLEFVQAADGSEFFQPCRETVRDCGTQHVVLHVDDLDRTCLCPNCVIAREG